MVSHQLARDARVDGTVSEPPTDSLIRAAALGNDEMASTFAWMRSVMLFAHGAGDEMGTLEPWLDACVRLDPRWPEPRAYGALMMASIGEVDAHQRMLEKASRDFPNDPWFPSALGMSRLLDSGDRQDAARWLAFAAELPGASPMVRAMAERLDENPP